MTMNETYTIINADGYIVRQNVTVIILDDGTVRIGGTLHLIDELDMSEDGTTIKHIPSGNTLLQD
jgi:hypothetical protein